MKRVGSWVFQIGRAVAEVVIACVLVSRTEGPFQTTVVCLLGLILQRVRFSSLEARASGELIGVLIARGAVLVKEQSETVEKLKYSADEQIRSMTTVESTVVNVEGWILNVVFALGLLKVCLTAIS